MGPPKADVDDQMATKTHRRRYSKLTDQYLEAIREFADDDTLLPVIVWDRDVRGLFARVGKHRSTWVFKKEHRDHGERGATVKRLGFHPEMSVARARVAARALDGKIAAGRPQPGKRVAVKLNDSLSEYLEHLEAKAAARGKPARWAHNVRHLARLLILPTFGKWSLIELSDELSDDPAAVAKWHRQMTKDHGAVSADHAAKIVRAIYRRALKLDRTLPQALPTSGVTFNPDVHGESTSGGLAPRDFPAWKRAVDRLPALRRSYYLVGLLTGTRPGELARLKWSDVIPRERVLVIKGAKAGGDIRIALSVPIVQALKIARGARGEGSGDLVFGRSANRNADRDNLSAYGNQLRRTYRTIVATMGIDELTAHFLMGHRPPGVSARYVVKLQAASGGAIREAQRRVSRRIIDLWGSGP
jgi:integrase